MNTCWAKRSMSQRGAICQNRFIAPVYTARFVRREPGPRPRGPLGPGAPVPVHRDAAPSSPVSPQGTPERCRLRVPSTRPGPHGAPSSPARAARSRSRSCRLPGASHGPHLPAVRSATPSCRCSRDRRAACGPRPSPPRPVAGCPAAPRANVRLRHGSRGQGEASSLSLRQPLTGRSLSAATAGAAPSGSRTRGARRPRGAAAGTDPGRGSAFLGRAFRARGPRPRGAGGAPADPFSGARQAARLLQPRFRQLSRGGDRRPRAANHDAFGADRKSGRNPRRDRRKRADRPWRRATRRRWRRWRRRRPRRRRS